MFVCWNDRLVSVGQSVCHHDCLRGHGCYTSMLQLWHVLVQNIYVNVVVATLCLVESSVKANIIMCLPALTIFVLRIRFH